MRRTNSWSCHAVIVGASANRIAAACEANFAAGERADQGNDGQNCREDDLNERRRARISDVIAFLSVLAQNIVGLRHERGLDAVEEEKRCIGENKRAELATSRALAQGCSIVPKFAMEISV